MRPTVQFSLSNSQISSSNLVFLQLPCDLLYLTLPADPDETTTPHHMLPLFFTITHLFDLFAEGIKVYARFVKDTFLLALRSAPLLRLFFVAMVQSVFVTWIRLVATGRKEKVGSSSSTPCSALRIPIRTSTAPSLCCLAEPHTAAGCELHKLCL